MQDVFLKNYDEANCPYKCVYTDNRTQYETEAAIIIFHIPNVDPNHLPRSNPNRLNAFYVIESPAYNTNYRRLPPNFFNVTVSYRKNTSEIWQENEIFEKMKKKTKLALQVVSHCDTTSQREHYVQKLKKYIKISEYGKCSGNVCNKDECMDAQIDKHLFYLAFENSVCQHYVTEKFWHVKRLIVPIVLSREHVQGLGIPNNAFIAASDFTSPQKLAEHLLYLQQNPKEYLK
uniref:Fucosyltransferase n=1 Tax=Ditylenchus dipsaci TaxID=166011 RepID=A0A915DJ11_9BILA